MIRQSFILAFVVGVTMADGVGAQERVPCSMSPCPVLAPPWGSWNARRAQGIARFRSLPPPTSSAPNDLLATAILRDVGSSTRPGAPTHWLEGGVVGAIGLGLFTGVFYGGLCESDSCRRRMVPYVVLSGAAGFVAGALVGGQFRRGAKDTTSTR